MACQASSRSGAGVKAEEGKARALRPAGAEAIPVPLSIVILATEPSSQAQR